jgi:hypothetical protein
MGSVLDAEEGSGDDAETQIENFFAKIKRFRAIATRYEKTARNFLAAVHLVAEASVKARRPV